MAALRARLLTRLRQLQLLGRLAREAGWRHLASLALLSAGGSLLEIAGLGLGVSLLLGAGEGSPLQLPLALPLQQGLALLVGVMLLRGLAQALVAVGQERLRSGFTDRLREQLLAQVLHAPSRQLEQLGRGDLLGLLMADISRSVLALSQAVRTLQGLLAMALYGAGVLGVGRQAALPLLLALAATAAAALLQRSGSWQLGRLQSRLNGAIQRTVGDGLHGLKAVRAAAAETWLLQRFAHDSQLFRRVLRQSVRRQALFGAWRDALVVLVVGLWLIWRGGELTPAATATTLLLAYRAGTALSGVIAAQRLCLGALPAYGELCRRRQLLQPGAVLASTPGPTAPSQSLPASPSAWEQLHWSISSAAATAFHPRELTLNAGGLVVVAGPSGSGKTTLLDRVCGLLDEQGSHWRLQPVHDGEPLQLSGAAGARQLRQLLAYAPQQAVLFEASLRHNLLLNQPPTPSADLHTWLERLGLGGLSQRPGGLDEPLPLALDHYSGGEIHRLGLLRAWLRNRPIEVLDEPTAFLDARAAARVRGILLERCRQRLVLVSSHDPELIALADQRVQLG
jgi:ABC-type transport system involved in cytochrome bd biosynthesis fused ATPase/permease subunit